MFQGMLHYIIHLLEPEKGRYDIDGIHELHKKLQLLLKTKNKEQYSTIHSQNEFRQWYRINLHEER